MSEEAMPDLGPAGPGLQTDRSDPGLRRRAPPGALSADGTPPYC